MVELGKPNYVGRSCYYYQGLNGGEGAAVDHMVSDNAQLIYSLQVIECQEQMLRYLEMADRDKDMEAVDALGGQLKKMRLDGE